MKNSDCKIPPFSLVYDMYISGLYGASYFVFIAKNAIYCLRVYVYSICKKLGRQIVGFCWRCICILEGAIYCNSFNIACNYTHRFVCSCT